VKKETLFDVVVTTQVPMRIGGPDDPLSAAQNVVSRVGDRLVIPGSTLKGAFRAQLEAFLIDRYYDSATNQWATGQEASKPCIPAAKPSPDEQRLARTGRFREGLCSYTDRDPSPEICPCCYLLGAMGMPGFVRVPFLYSDAAADDLYSASLDRATGSVRRGTNFPYELVPEGATFTGRLAVLTEDTLLGWRLGEAREFANGRTQDAWLRKSSLASDELIRDYVVARLASIGLLGGYKSKGFGDVTVEVREAAS
jgi:CRISPR/Cas system CSM-associated protein Csm3 (group 7 of RAMP superfamily)